MSLDNTDLGNALKVLYALMHEQSRKGAWIAAYNRDTGLVSDAVRQASAEQCLDDFDMEFTGV